MAVARDGWNAFDAEGQVRVAGALQMHHVGLPHEFYQGLHSPAHPRVVERADIEVEVFERFGRHFGHLRHRGSRPSQHAPARVLYANVVVNLLPDGVFVESLLVGRNVGQFRDIRAAAHAQIALHLPHGRLFDIGDRLPLLLAAGQHQGPIHHAALEPHDQAPAGAVDGGCERVGKLVRDVEGLDQDVVPLFYLAGIVDQKVGELSHTRVNHVVFLIVAVLFQVATSASEPGGYDRILLSTTAISQPARRAGTHFSTMLLPRLLPRSDKM